MRVVLVVNDCATHLTMERTSTRTMLPYADRVDSLDVTPPRSTLVLLSLPVVDKLGLVQLVHTVKLFTVDKLRTAHRPPQEITFDQMSPRNRDRAAPRELATVHV